jgi:hypothetical protein
MALISALLLAPAYSLLTAYGMNKDTCITGHKPSINMHGWNQIHGHYMHFYAQINGISSTSS